MGIFDIFKSRKREKEFLLEYVKAAKQGEALHQIRRAISTITTTNLSAADDTKLAYKASSILTASIVASAGYDLNSPEEDLAAGLFNMVISNHFSYLTATNFEVISTLSLIDLLGLEKAKERTSNIIDLYNMLASNRADVISVIGNFCAEWTQKPSSDNYQKFILLYQHVRSDTEQND